MTQEVTQTAPDSSTWTDDQKLAYTDRIRRGFIDTAVKEGVFTKGERADKALVLQALNDVDRSALTNKRIKADENAGEVNARAAVLVAGVIERLGHTAMRMEHPVPGRTAPSLPTDLPSVVLVPGETETAAAPMTYKSFMAEQGKKLGKEEPAK